MVTLTDGTSGGKSSMEVSAISTGEPSPAYFIAPQGWKEVPPSTVIAGSLALLGGDPCPNCAATAATFDNNYKAARGRAGWK